MTEPEPDTGRDGEPACGSSNRLERTFRISVTLKGLDGLLESLGGIGLLFVSPASINHFVRWATAHELAEDPHDFIARHLLHSASQLSASTTLYGAIYLLAHGLAKVVLVALVLRDKLWAYPWMIALLCAFIGYQTYRLTYKASVGLIALTLFDAFVAWLTWREYRLKRFRPAERVGTG
jgi:uncharacterized membrane protein